MMSVVNARKQVPYAECGYAECNNAERRGALLGYPMDINNE
jgi:hypothetical protein